MHQLTPRRDFFGDHAHCMQTKPADKHEQNERTREASKSVGGATDWTPTAPEVGSQAGCAGRVRSPLCALLCGRGCLRCTEPKSACERLTISDCAREIEKFWSTSELTTCEDGFAGYSVSYKGAL